jgi:mannose-6-phosphate isomerase class I
MKSVNVSINRLKVPKCWAESIVVGLDEFCEYVGKLIEREKEKNKRYPVLAFDGYPGVDWSIISVLEKKLKEKDLDVEIVDGFLLYKSPNEILEMIRRYITFDPFFGRVFDGRLENFLDGGNVGRLKEKIKKRKASGKIMICFGCGIANGFLRNSFSHRFYIDLNKTEFLKRIQETPLWFVPPEATLGRGAADIGLSVQTFKLSQYICGPVFDKHKRDVLKHLDFYVEGSVAEKPVLMPKEVFNGVLSALAHRPIRLKPLYIPSPWGGQWIKRVRGLSDKEYVNCAWSFEAIAPEMSLEVDIYTKRLEISFLTLLWRERKAIMGEYASKRFKWFFPIRLHYDDSWDGGDMAIQVHPNTSYVKNRFNESFGQHESYYIVATQPGSRVYLGLKEGINLEEFYNAAKKAETDGVPFDYDSYVNSIPSKPGDLFLIPAGTIHALGKNQVCVELGTTYGYTFHVYDYLRPDLSGNLRPIHLEHAFKAMKSYRKTNWVAHNLKQPPRTLRGGKGWAEYLLGRFREIPYEVHRLEFTKEVRDDTRGKFHVLALIDGSTVEIRSQEGPKKYIEINFSEAVIVPASFRKYKIVNRGKTPCKMLKVLLKG